MRIDVHNHAMPERALDLLRRDDTYGVKLAGRRWSGGMHVDFEIAESFTNPAAKIAELEAKGLEAAVVSVAPPLFYYHVDAGAGERMSQAVNEGLAEFCSAAPERLRWLATVPLQDSGRAADVLASAAEQSGCVGVEIGSTAADIRLDDPKLDSFWAAAADLELPVTIHPAYVESYLALNDYYLENVLGFLLETTVAVTRLICAGVLDRHPSLDVVLLHAGGFFPYQAGRLRHARTVRPELADSPVDPWEYLERLRFDVITHDVAALRYLVDRVGVGRVLLGTDLPFDMATPEPMLELVEAVGARRARAIAERNPAGLYGFPPLRTALAQVSPGL